MTKREIGLLEVFLTFHDNLNRFSDIEFEGNQIFGDDTFSFKDATIEKLLDIIGFPRDKKAQNATETENKWDFCRDGLYDILLDDKKTVKAKIKNILKYAPEYTK